MGFSTFNLSLFTEYSTPSRWIPSGLTANMLEEVDSNLMNSNLVELEQS